MQLLQQKTNVVFKGFCTKLPTREKLHNMASSTTKPKYMTNSASPETYSVKSALDSRKFWRRQWNSCIKYSRNRNKFLHHKIKQDIGITTNS